VMRFYRQRPMPFANLSKSIQPGNPTGKAEGSVQDTCFPSGRSWAARDRCSWASNSSCGFVTKRTVIFALPLIERANDVSTAINDAVLGGRSRHVHTGRTGADRAAVVTFAQAIDTTGRRRFAVNRLQILGLADFDETADCRFEEDDETCANRSRSARHSSWLGRCRR